MRILFASAVPFDASHRGGAQESTRDLCRALVARGTAVAALGGLHRPDGLSFQIGDEGGFEQICAADPAGMLPAVHKRFRPDLAVLACGDVRPLLRICVARSLPTLIYFRDVEFGTVNWRMPMRPGLGYLANSNFVAQAVRAGLGLPCEVLRPLVLRSRYEVATTRERVLFVNPIPKKGLRIALAMAHALPAIPFTFVEGWDAPPAEREPLVQACAQLGNIELAPPTDDMRQHYGRARIVLAPSVWEEGFGRVVAEAQVSGIPAIASRRGGLPEAVGPGGILEDPFAPVERWIRHLSRLWRDPPGYDALARAALQHATRPEMAEETIAQRILANATALISAKTRSPRPAHTPTPVSIGVQI